MAYTFQANKRNFVSSLLPVEFPLKNGDVAKLSQATTEHHEELRSILNICIRDGISYPFEDKMDLDQFRAYFFAFETFVVTIVKSDTFQPNEVVGGFYIKPNFPGRSSHICNAGFIVKPEARNQGMAKYMGTSFISLARELNYVASFFNLVYVNNPTSVHLWRSLGFQEIGVVPKAGRCKGADGSSYFVDAIQFYYDLSSEKVS